MNAPAQPVQKQSTTGGPVVPTHLSQCPASATKRRETAPVPTSLLKHSERMLMHWEFMTHTHWEAGLLHRG